MTINTYNYCRQQIRPFEVSPEDLRSVSNDIYKCDLCGSTSNEIKDGNRVCKNCGLIIEEEVYVYSFPFDDELIQIEKDRGERTQIGTKVERSTCKNSRLYTKLQKIHQSNDNEENTLKNAKVEINRIFNSLKLPYRLKTFAFQKFKTIRNNLKPSTKFRSPEKLVPVVIYMCMKFTNISINEEELLEVSTVSKKDFNAFKLLIGKYYPEYYTRNRQVYILRKVSELTHYYKSEFKSREMEFYHLSQEILERFWEQIKCTSDNVIAGTVSSLSLLTLFKDTISVNKVCKKLNIQMSTIQSQIKKHFIDRYHIQGFESLVKSADLLKKILIKLKVLKSEDQEEIEITPEIRAYLNQNF